MRDTQIFGALIADVLPHGTAVRFRAEGTSMYPTIRDGETITVAAVAASDIVRGDVLLCQHGARLLAHRVVGVTTCGGERVFELRGDAKASGDGAIGERAIVGRVIDVGRDRRRIAVSGRGARCRRLARLTAARAKRFVAALAAFLVRAAGVAAASAGFHRR